MFLFGNLGGILLYLRYQVLCVCIFSYSKTTLGLSAEFTKGNRTHDFSIVNLQTYRRTSGECQVPTTPLQLFGYDRIFYKCTLISKFQP